MDGFRKSFLLQIFLALAACAELLGQASPSQAVLRVGLLPTLLTAPPAEQISSAFSLSQREAFASVLQSQLLAACAAEKNLLLLRNAVGTDPLRADSVRAYCEKYKYEKLLLPALEWTHGAPSEATHVRVLLRWFDAASGEMTKFHIEDLTTSSTDTLLHEFNAAAAIKTLLEAPELILRQEQQAAAMPVLRDLPPLLQAPSKSKRWLWYVSAAALLSGSSAYWLLREPNATTTKKLLPEPPGPPSH